MRRVSLLAFFCVACLSATDVDEFLVLTLRSDRTVLASGDTAYLRITLANRSDQDITVSTPACRPFFTVFDSVGQKITPPQSQCSVIETAATTVPANDSVWFDEFWSAEGRTSRGETSRVDPGTYSIVALMYGTHRQLESRSVHIQVLP